jgi:hypothetical protein
VTRTRRLEALERAVAAAQELPEESALETLAAKLWDLNAREAALLADPEACDLASRRVAALADDTDAAYLEATAALTSRLAELVAND